MRILGADYIENEKLLNIVIVDQNEVCMQVVETMNIEDVIDEDQVISLCEQLYKRFDCDEMILDN